MSVNIKYDKQKSYPLNNEIKVFKSKNSAWIK